MTPYCTLVHLDLDALDAAAPLSGRTFVVFWRWGVPLGHHVLEATDDVVRPAQLVAQVRPDLLRTVTRHDALYGAQDQGWAGVEGGAQHARHGAPGQPAPSDVLAPPLAGPTIGIVIPTRDRPGMLEACLRSVQELRTKPREVIVVDTALPLLEAPRVVSRFAGVRYLAAPGAGASAARNAGVRHCRSSLIAFLDDDERPHPDWLTWIGACFRSPDVVVATGLTLPAELGTRAQFLFEQQHSFIRGYKPRTFGPSFYARTKARGVPVWYIGGSGNMAVRRAAFMQLGGFDERLGAGRAGCSEDTEFFYRVLARGGLCRYEPGAVVHHHHRSTMRELEGQLHTYMRGHVVALLVQSARYKDSGNLYRALWKLPRHYAGRVGHALARRTDRPARLLRAEVTGFLAGLASYWRYGRSGAARLPRLMPPPLLPEARGASGPPSACRDL